MSGEMMVPANGVDLCVETFGERTDPPLLLIAGGASAMDWWEDEFCRRLGAGGRFVIRYDHRDTGRSTSFPAGCARRIRTWTSRTTRSACSTRWA